MYDLHFTRRGFIFIADKSDAKVIETRKWECVDNARGRFYVRSGNIYLHRLLLSAPKGLVVDHINGNSLDNRRQNLRLCTSRQNSVNCRDKTNKWGYRGIFWSKNKWRASLSVHHKCIKSHYCETVVEAAREYDKLAIKHNGEFARLNFPRSDYE